VKYSNCYKKNYFKLDCDETENISYVNPYVLRLIKDAIANEAEGAAHYTELAEKYPEHKEHFTAMATDEKKHNKMLTALYKELSANELNGQATTDTSEEVTDTDFETDLKNALEDELSDAKLYRTLYFTMTKPAYKNVLFEIMTDELMHADMLGMME
jgi:rubrerythrin